ncbi:MAG: GntR family transcriptional regulator [Verrucomicrobiota bacterium]
MDPVDSIEWKTAPTSEQQVADTLRTAILDGKLPVGEFLSQRKLAGLADSSVISVRGALRQLENEGLIENVPRMGVRIPVETPSAVRDRYLVRKSLETTAIEHICGKLPQETAHRLMEIAHELDKLAASHTAETYPEFARLHQDFHLMIAESTGSPLLAQMLKRVINPSLMLLNAARSWKRPSELHQNHTLLVEAIISGDPGKAVQAIQNHIQIGLESELATL